MSLDPEEIMRRPCSVCGAASDGAAFKCDGGAILEQSLKSYCNAHMPGKKPGSVPSASKPPKQENS